MSKHAINFDPVKALFIKLGPKGSWEKECVDKGILRFGYEDTPFGAAVDGDWETVRKVWQGKRGNEGVAARDVQQIKHFFESEENIVWITFYDGLLWWCFAKPGVMLSENKTGSFQRITLDGWHSRDVTGQALSREKLSGSLLKVQGFRGTICEIKDKDFEYLKRRLNGKRLPEVNAAEEAERLMLYSMVPLMRLLTWQDFELLVDLVFANSGWRRIGQVGKEQKTIDIELVLPTTGDRAFVQIKSTANNEDLNKCLMHLKGSPIYQKMFFVWHSGDITDVEEAESYNVKLVGPEELAKMVLDAGLASWLRKKVS